MPNKYQTCGNKHTNIHEPAKIQTHHPPTTTTPVNVTICPSHPQGGKIIKSASPERSRRGWWGEVKGFKGGRMEDAGRTGKRSKRIKRRLGATTPKRLTDLAERLPQ
jgi:hypothetical protein